MPKIHEIKSVKDYIFSSKNNNKYFRIITISIFVIIFAIIYGFYYLGSKVSILSNNLEALKNDYASTTNTLKNSIEKNRVDLSNALSQEKQNVGEIANKLGTYQNQVSSITGTVTTLQKLSKIDTELLQKYSKIFFLNEHYAPAQLSEVASSFVYNESKHLKLESHVIPYLNRMIEDALKDNVTLYVFSAYRSFNEQNALKNQYTITYGAGTANSFSADQGYSEHQLGTTVDLITPGLGGNLEGFDRTKAFEWMKTNAHRYGFILSYPQNNGFYVYEPWHWRFVGVILANDLHIMNKNFYDLDQRKIDEYLVNLFD